MVLLPMGSRTFFIFGWLVVKLLSTGLWVEAAREFESGLSQSRVVRPPVAGIGEVQEVRS